MSAKDTLACAETAQARDTAPSPSAGDDPGLQAFRAAAAGGANLVPLFQRILSDHLTPVLAYRCLVREDERTAPSFLFESVINGDQQVRLRRSEHRSTSRVALCKVASKCMRCCAFSRRIKAACAAEQAVSTA